MKIHFEPKDLLKALKIVRGVVPKTSFTPALRYVKVCANFDSVTLQATDRSFGIRVKVDVDVSEPGCVLLPVKEVIDSLTTIPKDFKTTIEYTDEGVLTIDDPTGTAWSFAPEESIDELRHIFIIPSGFTRGRWIRCDAAFRLLSPVEMRQ